MTAAVNTERWRFGFGALFVAVIYAENMHATILYIKPQHYNINFFFQTGDRRNCSHIMIVVSTLPLFDHLREAEFTLVIRTSCCTIPHTPCEGFNTVGGTAVKAVKVSNRMLFGCFDHVLNGLIMDVSTQKILESSFVMKLTNEVLRFEL